MWKSQASLPQGEYGGAFFVLHGKGYVACGYTNNGLSSNVYMYDPSSQTWTQMSNFPGIARQNTIGFTLNGKGYLFGGFLGGSTAGNDMWEYNDTTDTWTQKANCPGPTRDSPTELVINGQAFVGRGAAATGSPVYSDFYQFDPIQNTYTPVSSIPIARATPAHFSIDSLGYIGLGYMGPSTVGQDFYRFSPSTNTWTQLADFSGLARGWTFSEIVNGQAFLGAGGDLNNNIYYNDVWTWGYPTGISNVNISQSIFEFPNPTTGTFTLRTTNQQGKEYVINDVLGKTIRQGVFVSDTQIIDIGAVASGIYSITVKGQGTILRINKL